MSTQWCEQAGALCKNRNILCWGADHKDHGLHANSLAGTETETEMLSAAVNKKGPGRCAHADCHCSACPGVQAKSSVPALCHSCVAVRHG